MIASLKYVLSRANKLIMGNIEKLKVSSLVYPAALVCTIALASCSKKVVYMAPPALSQEYVSSLSNEKQMAYRFVTAPKSDNLIVPVANDL